VNYGNQKEYPHYNSDLEDNMWSTGQRYFRQEEVEAMRNNICYKMAKSQYQ
jgi:hypothetical protein